MKKIFLLFSLFTLFLPACSFFESTNPDTEFDQMYQDGSEKLDEKINQLTSQTMKDQINNAPEDKQLAPPIAGDTVATLETNFGTIKFKFFLNEAPELSKNFIELAKTGYYNELTFHRIISGFMIQGGDPLGNGTGGKSYTGMGLADEKGALALKHYPGAVAWAKSSAPNSIGSQFFINHKRSAFLDNSYSVFGQVYEGMDVVDKIANTPVNGESPKEKVVIESVTIGTY